jgi:hypothetical protein
MPPSIDMSKVGPLQIFVDSPMTLTLKENALTIQCYQQIAGQAEALRMDLVFSSSATGGLFTAVKNLLESGIATLSKGDVPGMQ